ncbi:MAG: hypothetical protein INR64_15480 [Caulobacteraceae bacterium]|nr:hypothetical protein [Caulobacter sp.]
MRGRLGAGALAALAAAALVGCERASTTARVRTDDRPAASGGAADYASRDTGYGGRSADSSGSAAGDRGSGGGYADIGGYGARRSRAPVPDFHGEPMWSDNRRYSAQENATYHCGKNGPDIDAKGLDDCLTKVHAFIDHPPSDVETLSRPNGDKLMYDPKANLFVVARKDGAPRTFFKPSTGAAYWTEQKQRVASGDDGYRRRSGGSDEGSGA